MNNCTISAKLSLVVTIYVGKTGSGSQILLRHIYSLAQNGKNFVILSLIILPYTIWCQTSTSDCHCVKRVRIRSYSGQHFPAFGLNKERYGVSLCIQSECGKMQIRIAPNTDTFHSVSVFQMSSKFRNAIKSLLGCSTLGFTFL